MEGSQHGREDYPEQVGEALKCEMLVVLACFSCSSSFSYVPAFRSKARTAYKSEVHTHVI